MQAETKVQAYWNTLAPLYRKAGRYQIERDDYNQQTKRPLTDLLVRAQPVAVATGDWRVFDGIKAALSRESAFFESAEAVLKDLQKVLPASIVRQLRERLYPRWLPATCENTVTMTNCLKCDGPPPPDDWPGTPTDADGWLVDYSLIEALEEASSGTEGCYRGDAQAPKASNVADEGRRGDGGLHLPPS